MVPRPSAAETLARYFSPLAYEDLPVSLITRLKAFFLDWLGSAFAGSQHPPVRMMVSLAEEMPGGGATIFPAMTGHYPLIAALVNGAASHMVEMDDLHRPSILHPAASILPAVLSASEKEHASGRTLILGILTGYEVGIRAALAAGKSHYEFWHTTGTCGTFGAAAGAAKVMGLGPDPFTWALGSAGTQSAGLWEFLTDGAMSKQLHPGKASMNGLLAALLAQKGFTGARTIFEGEKGFLRATSRAPDPEILTAGLGETFHAAGNSLKFYASCGHTHSAIESALVARKRLPAGVQDIQSIEVAIYQEALDLLGDVEARTPYLAKFNLPFCIATAVAFGHADLEDFTEERLSHPDIQRLLPRIRIREDSELTRAYPQKWPSRTRITLKNGQWAEGSCDFPKGDPENPLSEAELITKFKKLSGGVLADDTQNHIIDIAMNLEKINDVASVFQAIAERRPGR